LRDFLVAGGRLVEMKNRILPIILPCRAGPGPRACTQFPAAQTAVPAPSCLPADYPAWVPIDPLLAKGRGRRGNIPQIENGLERHGSNGLQQARAARCVESVLSGSEKQRLSKVLR